MLVSCEFGGLVNWKFNYFQLVYINYLLFLFFYFFIFLMKKNCLLDCAFSCYFFIISANDSREKFSPPLLSNNEM